MKELKVNIIDENVFILLEDVEVEVLGYTIRVKKDFDFDGASIPKIFWSTIGNPLTGDYKIAALIHDALYASQELQKELADNIFLEIMRLHGVSYAKRYSMYNAVKHFGGSAWENNKVEVNKYKGFINVKENNY